MSFAPCWSCGSDSDCYSDCECAKCIDPIGYQNWKDYSPEEYEAWVESQQEDDY